VTAEFSFESAGNSDAPMWLKLKLQWQCTVYIFCTRLCQKLTV